MQSINAKTPFKSKRAARAIDPRVKEDTLRVRAMLQVLISGLKDAEVDLVGYDPDSAAATLQFRVAGSTALLTVQVCPECATGKCERNKVHDSQALRAALNER